jgi:hypothetical protein
MSKGRWLNGRMRGRERLSNKENAAMSKAKSGGGPNMNKNVRVPIRSGPPNTKVISPAASANIGISKGNHAESGTVRRPPEPLVQGTRPQVAMGNAKALDVGKGGPGSGRTVYRSGSQSQHGAANPGSGDLPRTPGGGPGGFGFTGKGD